jgi:hypothetical protein
MTAVREANFEEGDIALTGPFAIEIEGCRSRYEDDRCREDCITTQIGR